MAENAPSKERWSQSESHDNWVIDDTGEVVAEVFGPDDVYLARLRLFIAAPDMLAALELVREQFGYSLPADYLDKIDEAIKLAKEGRQ